MKRMLKQVSVLVFVCFTFQANKGMSQVDIFSDSALTNAEIRALLVRSNADARAEYRRLHPTEKDLEWASNAMRNAKSPELWPVPSKKQEIFEHCVEELRSAIDVDQVELACRELTNQPEKALALQNFTKVAISNFNDFAEVILRPELSSDAGHAGYIARIYEPTNYFIFLFWSENGPVRQIEKRTPDSMHVLSSARFYKSGKVQEFRVNSPDGQGRFRSDEIVSFKENGELDSFWEKP